MECVLKQLKYKQHENRIDFNSVGIKMQTFRIRMFGSGVNGEANTCHRIRWRKLFVFHWDERMFAFMKNNNKKDILFQCLTEQRVRSILRAGLVYNMQHTAQNDIIFDQPMWIHDEEKWRNQQRKERKKNDWKRKTHSTKSRWNHFTEYATRTYRTRSYRVSDVHDSWIVLASVFILFFFLFVDRKRWCECWWWFCTFSISTDLSLRAMVCCFSLWGNGVFLRLKLKQ